MNCDKQKIFVLVLPETGHMNPLLCVAKELKSKNYDVIFYGKISQKDIIERSGSQFRTYQFYKDTKFDSLKKDPSNNIVQFLNDLIDTSFNEIPKLIDDVIRDKPDLIIFDNLSYPAKFMMKVIRHYYNRGKFSNKIPLFVQFFTFMPTIKDVYPSKELIEKVSEVPTGIQYNFSKKILTLKQWFFCQYFKIDFCDPFQFFSIPIDLNIVTILPDIQPYREKFNDAFKFVGCCLSDQVRKGESVDQKLSEYLEIFKPINPYNSRNNQNKYKLIYASLGTVFTNNMFLYDTIINSIVELNKELENVKVVLSVGKDNMDLYKRRLEKENFIIPSNILLVQFAPQIDLLERANLFITHCGMNSSSEAVHYGVPIIAIPIKADQPRVAYRLCDELKLGLRFKALNLTPQDLKNGILKVLNEKAFLENVLKLTNESRKHNGVSNATELIINYLNECKC